MDVQQAISLGTSAPVAKGIDDTRTSVYLSLGRVIVLLFPLACLLCDSTVIFCFVCSTSMFRAIVELEEGTSVCTDTKDMVNKSVAWISALVKPLCAVYNLRTCVWWPYLHLRPQSLPWSAHLKCSIGRRELDGRQQQPF